MKRMKMCYYYKMSQKYIMISMKNNKILFTNNKTKF